MKRIHIVEINKESTGGNVNVYYGKLDNGVYFVYGINFDMMYLYDSDYAEVYTKEFFEKTEGDTYEWEREHSKGEVDLNGCSITHDESCYCIFMELLEEMELNGWKEV